MFMQEASHGASLEEVNGQYEGSKENLGKRLYALASQLSLPQRATLTF